MKTLLVLIFLSAQTLFAAEIPKEEVITPMLEGSSEIRSLLEVERLGLNQGATTLDLWSGHYWPHYQGSLAVRYRDPYFLPLIKKEEQKFSEYKKLYEKRSHYYYRNNMNILSPAEKYDLLVGDAAMSLTKASWQLGKDNLVMGNVPSWRGICDGWSSAAQKMPRPQRSVEMSTPSGEKITFYPEDIKALGSMLYGFNQDAPIFLGKRCKVNIPNPFSNACNAMNPASFHKTLINRVGKMGKSFIGDVDPGTEVWNYPVKRYKFTYYNVFSEQESNSIRDVAARFKDRFKFRKPLSRHKNTYYIVGVVAEVVYADMRPAPHSEQDGPEYDKELVKEYDYDLELDYNFNIIGGEGYGKTLPDFIWAPNDVTYPLSNIEFQAGEPKSTSDVITMARKAAKDAQPLSVIVKELFELSR